MVLFFPISGIVWILIWVVRSLRGKSVPQTKGYVPPGKGEPASLGGVLTFVFLYFPAACAAAIYVGDSNSASWAFLTFACALLAPCFLLYWLAWRILGPLGWSRLGRAVLFLAPSGSYEARQGNRELFSAAFDRKRTPEPWDANLWSLFVVALQGEAAGSLPATERLLDFLDENRTTRLPHRLRGQAFELLAWPALQAGHWKEARRRLAPGRGRGVRLLRMLASAHLSTPPSRLLWLAWLLAPERRRTFAFVQAALDDPHATGGRPAEERAAPMNEKMGEETVWRRHLELLAAAAAGNSVMAGDVESLAEGWEPVLGPRNFRRLMTRAVELGAPDAQAAAAALRPAIEAELEDLAEAVEGAWVEPKRSGGLVAKVQQGRLDRLFAAVQAEVEPFRGHDFATFPRRLDSPLAEMERWLQFRLSLRRLLAAEAKALPTAWHNGLRLAACNWPVFLLRTHGGRAHWACREMSSWCETLARKVGDEEIVTLSHGNSRVGLRLRG